jgi:hypothetical protein
MIIGWNTTRLHFETAPSVPSRSKSVQFWTGRLEHQGLAGLMASEKDLWAKREPCHESGIAAKFVPQWVTCILNPLSRYSQTVWSTPSESGSLGQGRLQFSPLPLVGCSRSQFDDVSACIVHLPDPTLYSPPGSLGHLDEIHDTAQWQHPAARGNNLVLAA